MAFVKRHSRAFTIMEVLIVVSMAALLIIASSYSYVDWQQNQASRALSNQVFAALRLAKNIAINTGQMVSVCAGTDTTLSACNTGAANWNNGWMVFLDPNGNGTYSAANLVQAYQITNINNPNTDVDTTGVLKSYATFNTLGFATRQVHITFKPTGCTGTNGMDVYLNGSGRVTTSSISCP